MSMIGRVFSNFRDFYNEINAATLTGAIDVIVVEQPDGTFTCSPFHVRFGKLGVLRSREKVVDIEINGQPQDIHMKLGDSGEAFFVEETTDNEDIPDPWATSPIPVSDFEELYTAATSEIPRRKSVDLNFVGEVAENQVNDYSQRRYTGGNEFDYSTQKREFVSRQVELGNIRTIEHSAEDISVLSNTKTDDNSVTNKTSNDEDEHIFHMDSFEEQIPLPDLASPIQPKIFNAETVNADKQILINSFTPIKCDEVEDPDLVSIVNTDSKSGCDPDVKNGKKRRRKKSVMKKKNSQRKSSSSNIDPKSITETSGVENIDLKMSESITDKSGIGTDDSEDLSPAEADSSPRNLNRDPDFHFFSDTELTSANSMNLSRANTPVQSDTEFEFSQRKPEPEEAGQSWAWGQLPRTIQQDGCGKEEKQDQNAERNSMLSGMFSFMKQNKRMRHAQDSDGLYLADLNSLDPEVTALYFPRKPEKNTEADNDCESGNGPSLPQSPGSIDGAKSIDSDFDDSKDIHKYLQDISLSLCGWQQSPNPDRFVRHLVAFSDLCNNPGILESNDLVIRVNSKYYNWKTAMPIVMSLLIYRRPLPQSTVEQLCSMHMPEISMVDKMTKNESKSYSWWSWRRSKSSVDTVTIQPTDGNHTKLDSSIEIEELPEITSATITVTETDGINTEHVIMQSISTHPEDKSIELPKMHKSHDESGSQSSEDDQLGRDIPNKPKRSDSEEKYRKTLRLSSEQIVSLNLNEGMNEVEFSVTTAYQGTTRCKCHIYRWRYDDKIVISDIDGTITKSDVLGHILPIVGKDWAQSGVAQLFTKIKNNGYKLLYLSARAIGQARVTREYLKSIKQGDLSLPDGPLLLNPTSLMSAFHREVIEKKPEQFKIQCLSDIRALFSSDSNPFYAGYGNRINDAWAYRAVGIPIVRIFTINHKGELKHEFSQTFQSSYSNMSYIVDQLFPPLLEDANDFSQFIYWREPISTIDEPLPEVV